MRITKEKIYDMVHSHTSLKSLYIKSELRNIHVAILLKHGKILGIDRNHYGSRKRGCGYTDRTIHAERAVLKKVGDVTKLNGCIMIVIRFARKDTELINSVPCHSCRCHLEKCMKEYGLRRIYYSE